MLHKVIDVNVDVGEIRRQYVAAAIRRRSFLERLIRPACASLELEAASLGVITSVTRINVESLRSIWNVTCVSFGIKGIWYLTLKRSQNSNLQVQSHCAHEHTDQTHRKNRCQVHTKHACT